MMRRWEAILRCLHLIDNSKLVRDPQDLALNKVAKIRPLLENFVYKSEVLYNLEREGTVDELIIAYKGKYCILRQFMQNKPTRFELKL
jgi:hypothetical protein